MSLLERARAYLSAIEARADTARYFCPDVVQREFPNALVRNGAERDLAALLAGAEKGKRVLSGEKYEIVNALEAGDQLAMEVIWTGTLAIPLGTLAAGDTMKAHFGVFLTFRDGRICRQHNYDCFDPF
ncbi:MAG TPA: nuclear transport factor 2 family protein [Polyangiaceae bacterium]|nr:nuclear transport factor 2 family protein [Polyangiaceae bacterium]